MSRLHFVTYVLGPHISAYTLLAGAHLVAPGVISGGAVKINPPRCDASPWTYSSTHGNTTRWPARDICRRDQSPVGARSDA